MKSLKICNYEILNFESDPLIYSSHGITKITDTHLAQALRKINERNKNEASIEFIQETLSREGLCVESAIEFLKSIAVLAHDTPQPYLQRTIVFCDWQLTPNMPNISDTLNPMKIEIRDLDYTYLPEHKIPTFFILLTRALDHKKLRTTYRKIVENNSASAISIGIISGNYFHLTEPFIPAIKNPCAFCTIDRIIHYETIKPSHHRWSRLLVFCQKRDLPLPTIEVEALHNALIFGTVLKAAKRLTTPHTVKTTQDKTLQSLTVNLETGYIKEEPSVHWWMCDCLEISK
ncbi:McbB family protein [Pseudomonas putida]